MSGTTAATASAGTTTPTATTTPATFAEDVAFLEKHGAVQILESDLGARVAVSAKYQGRVMTSSVSATGRSFGWIHRAFISAEKTGTAFNNYGGEDRFWLGPEGGQFGLYFPKGSAFAFDAWQVPHALQEGAWDVVTQSKSKISFHHAMDVANWTGTPFSVDVKRSVSLIDRDTARRLLGLDAVGSSIEMVGFETVNELKNVGKAPWKKDSGLLSMWILAMFSPAADGRVVIPFSPGKEANLGPIVNDAYFGKVPADRLSVHEDKSFLVFKVDGLARGKIGLGPMRARGLAGSYSAAAKLLTIVQYPMPAKKKTPLPYVNSMWEQQKEPYGGDVVNSYNDGPTGPGKPALGGFYEIETSSPGEELAPGQSATHTHRTFHIVGEPAALEPIVRATFGASLAELTLP